ncbi:MAG: hypothetical protein WDO74_30890 [Pseudomonadota bacterium]
MPRGVFDAQLRRTLFFALLAGLAMALVARLTHSFSPFVAAPVAVLAYGAVLFMTGEINRTQLAAIKGTVTRKLSRNR